MHTSAALSSTCRKWIEEKAKNQLLTSKLVDSALYEVQVVTGAAKGAGTDARVYMEMFGVEEGTSSGEVRLLDVDSRQAPFKRGATDCFAVSGVGRCLWSCVLVWLVLCGW